MRLIPSFLRIYFPIRLKLLLIQLLVVATAVAVITVTMARLFHTDKTAYIHDLTSTIALHTAEETNALLVSYQERLQVFARIMAAEGIPAKEKSEILKKLFQDFQEFVMITEYEGNRQKNAIYDVRAIEAAGLTKEKLETYRRAHPLPLARIAKGEIFIENSTISARMPALTVAVSESAEGSATPRVVAALVRLDALIKLAGRSRVFETFIIDCNGSILAHPDVAKVAAHLVPKGLPGVAQLRKGGSLGRTAEYAQGGVEMIGGLAPVEFAGIIAVVEIPKATAYLTAKTLLHYLLGAALMLLVASAILTFFWSRRLTRPIERLSDAARVVGHGEFDIQVVPEGRDEIGDLASTFNQMAAELKMRETALQAAQAQLVQSEKMAAFGQLSAGIAHEVKNPLAGILGFAQLTLRKLQDDDPISNNIKVIEKETKRCRLIIDNLMKFARQEKVAYSPFDVNSVVEDAAAIVDHQLGIHQVRLEKEFVPSLPIVFGNGNQIEQVLINMMINAQQAMDGKPGTIKLETALSSSGDVEIHIKDNGPGIPQEIQAKIFEPFFTTKAAGKGTGLGLSVSYGIVKEHKGEITLHSEAGLGTEFIITLPKPDSGQAIELPEHPVV